MRRVQYQPASLEPPPSTVGHGGIVKRRRQGKNNLYSLTDLGYRLSKIVKGMV